jgi:vacuolar protein sorting-associated protein 18
VFSSCETQKKREVLNLALRTHAPAALRDLFFVVRVERMSLFSSWSNQNKKRSGDSGSGKSSGNPFQTDAPAAPRLSGGGNPFGKPPPQAKKPSANPFFQAGSSAGVGIPQASENPFATSANAKTTSSFSSIPRASQFSDLPSSFSSNTDDAEEAYREQLVRKKKAHFARRNKTKTSRATDADEKAKYPLFKIVRQDSWQTDSVRQSKGNILVMTAANRTLIFATSNQRIVRWSMNSGEPAEEFDVSKKCGGNIERLFLDPTGSHLIIACNNSENFYMHSSYKKVRTLHKTKGVYLCSVAWNKKEGTEKNTKAILLGGRNGEIYETSLDDVNREKYFKKVYQLTESPGIVCGIEWETFHTGISEEESKYFVMVATAEPSRHYHFIGGPTFEGLFGRYDEDQHDRFSEVPGHLPYGELHFYSESSEMRAESFALLTQIGVVNGQFMFGSQSVGDTVVKDSKLVKYPRRSEQDGSMMGMSSAAGSGGSQSDSAGGSAPLSMMVTKFHFLFLYEDRLVAVSRLSSATKVTFEIQLDRHYHGVVKSLVRDPVGSKLWLCTATSVFQIVLDREDRDVWNLYLDQAKQGDGREFEFAFQHANTKEQQEIVRSVQADYYFERKEYVIAARYYAMTSRSFEEVALKFADEDSEKALKTFVQAKLESLGRTQSTQRTILSLWLVEMSLSQMNEEENSDMLGDTELALLQTEFKNFLSANKAHLGMSECAETTFQLISSHGRMDMLLYFAELIEDYERMMMLHVQEENYEGAVELLQVQSQKYIEIHRRPPEKIENLFYKFSPVLMEHAPKSTVQAWKGMRRFLVASKLIPSLVRYSQRKQEMAQRSIRKQELKVRLQKYDSYSDATGDDEDGQKDDGKDYAVEYLEFCVTENRNKEAAIHNFLVSLYAQRQDEGKKIIEFLDSQGPKPCFDLDYALRVCIRSNQSLACIRIYSMMGLPDEAVSLALRSGNIELAKKHADMPTDDDDMKKKLWLKIAKQIITQQGDIKQAIEIIRDSDELLKIEDILPLFPDFTAIEDFKDEVCVALEGYTEQIKALKEEMNEYVESAEQIREDIKRLQKRSGQVNTRARCELTGQYIIGNEFYLLPDGRAYLADALLKWVLENEKNCVRAGFEIDFKSIRALKEEIRLIDENFEETAARGESYKQVALANRRSAQKQLDENIANGVIIDMIHIANIDVPFTADGEDPSSWDL